MSSTSSIESVLTEKRSFPPPPEFAARAHVKSWAEYEQLYRKAADDPEGFWASVAGELRWESPWQRVLDWKLPYAKWFVGGKLNVSVNCLDRHLASARKNKAAILWEGEPGDTRVITYAQLHREVCMAANALTELGVKRGRPRRDLHADDSRGGRRDAGLRAASARRTPSCSAGSRPRRSPIASRTVGAKLVITADGGWRRGAIVPLKDNVDRALRRHRRSTTSSSSNAAATRSRGTRATAGGTTRSPVSRRATSRTASTASIRCSPLHERHDRQAEGHPAHHRRLPGRRGLHDAAWSSTCTTTTSTGARPTSAG